MGVDDLSQLQPAIGGLLLESWQHPIEMGQSSQMSCQVEHTQKGWQDL